MVDELENKDSEEDVYITDKDLPLSFNNDRHLEIIGGINCITQTWRMKERVSPQHKSTLTRDITSQIADENSECSLGVVLERRRRSAGYHENPTLC